MTTRDARTVVHRRRPTSHGRISLLAEPIGGGHISLIVDVRIVLQRPRSLGASTAEAVLAELSAGGDNAGEPVDRSVEDRKRERVESHIRHIGLLG